MGRLHSGWGRAAAHGSARGGAAFRRFQHVNIRVDQLKEGQLHEEFDLDQEFEIVELEPRRAASPDAQGSGGSGGSGGGSGGSGSGGSGGSGGGMSGSGGSGT
jgi:hypothetical protein